MNQIDLRLRLPILLLAGISTSAFAQAASPTPAPLTAPARAAPQAAPDDMSDDEIVVTGQKPVGSVVGDIPPEQVLSPADVRAYGVNSISDLLDQLSPQTTSMRGRGGEQPVVLLNGRRISSFMEIRDLPTEAILRVEILPEEVALKYGYSADQRVVNFVLRPRFRSKSIDTDAGATTEGGGATGNIEAGLVRILRDNRFNIDARVRQSDRLLESDRDLTSPAADGTDLSPYRTLRPRTRTATLNTVYARPLSKTISGTINAMLSATDSDALEGLPTGALIIPAGSPFGSAASASIVGRTLGINPLTQDSRTLSGHLGVSVNGMLDQWRWSFTGNYDHADGLTNSETGVDTTALQARISAADPTVNPNGNLTPYLGTTLLNRARSLSDTGNVQMVANGKLAELPAGALSTTLKVGGTFTSLDSRSERSGLIQNTDLSRQAANGQINLDLPLTSRRTGFLAGIGNLTANVNLAVNQLSDYGTQRTYGYGLNWSPRAPISFIASFTDDQGVPTVQQLGNPVILTAQTRVFDYRKGATVDVAAISGGNPSLLADDRRVIKLGMNWKPSTKTDLTFNANYVRSSIRNAIATLPEPTSDIESAFPDRFVRDANGNLIRIDTRATNFSREREQTFRWGFNLSIPLKPSQAAIDAFRKVVRERFGGAFPGAPGGAPAGAPGQTPPPPPTGDAPPPGDAPQRPPEAGGGGGGFGGPPPGGGGFGGAPGGGGGFGGRGGGSRFAQNAGGRIQLTFYHTWTFQDDILVRPGVPLIDLLNGGAVGSTGGQPRHQIDTQLGYSNNGIGARLSETWKSGTRVDAAAGSTTGDLRFSSLATTDLRMFLDVGQLPRFIGKDWARNLRVSFAVSNIFDQRQRVRDAMGTTPIRYQGAYLDPAGRAFTISIRKLFSPIPARSVTRPSRS